MSLDAEPELRPAWWMWLVALPVVLLLVALVYGFALGLFVLLALLAGAAFGKPGVIGFLALVWAAVLWRILR